MPGLLIGGSERQVDGVRVVNVRDAAWDKPGFGDGRPRDRRFGNGAIIPPQIWMLHKTIADDPERLIPGVGPSANFGGAQDTILAWGKDPAYSGAHVVTGHDGTVVCVADLLLMEMFHATASNPYSVGHETKEVYGGGFFESAAHATVLTTIAGCRALGIQIQIPSRMYAGHPLRRMINGGHDVVGILGHRDNTERRGRWDPGDLLFSMLRAQGAEAFDYDAGEDLATWKARQTALNLKGYHLTVDGIPGPATTAALKAEGYVDGIWALGRAA